MNTEQTQTLGELIRRYRVAAGLTQAGLAEKAGLRERTISDLERGLSTAPHAHTVASLIKALALGPEDHRALTTAAMPRQRPRVGAPTFLSELRTFLIAGVCGYTRFAQEHGDEAAARLAACFATAAREGVATQGGRVFELRGDEALAVFGSARQALRAALEVQARVAQQAAGDPTLPLSVGIGLDAGEVIPVEGGYRGGALNLAARLCGLAGPGEVLASAGVVHLARRTEGLAYVDRGEVALHGLPDPVRVVQVLPEGAAPVTDGHAFDVDLVSNGARQVHRAAFDGGAQAAMTVEDRAATTGPPQGGPSAEPAQAEAVTLLSPVRPPRQETTPTPASLPSTDRPAPPLDAHYGIVIRAIADGLVVPFLGNDVNLCGRPTGLAWQRGHYLPSDAELAAHLAESFGYPWSDGPDLARVSQYVTVMIGLSPLYAALRGIFAADYPPTLVHRFLASLPAALRARGYPVRYQLIVTTTYDDVLERTFQAAGEPFDLLAYVAEGEHRGRLVHRSPDGDVRLIERPNEYRGLSLDQRTVILKMHGAAHQESAERDSYVITEDHHIGYLTRLDLSNLIPATLLARLRTSHLLFLGYSLRNWHQRVILHRLWGEQKLSDNYKSWAVQSAVEPIDQEFWSKRDVGILPASLDGYIGELSRRVQALADADADADADGEA